MSNKKGKKSGGWFGESKRHREAAIKSKATDMLGKSVSSGKELVKSEVVDKLEKAGWIRGKAGIGVSWMSPDSRMGLPKSQEIPSNFGKPVYTEFMDFPAANQVKNTSYVYIGLLKKNSKKPVKSFTALDGSYLYRLVSILLGKPSKAKGRSLELTITSKGVWVIDLEGVEPIFIITPYTSDIRDMFRLGSKSDTDTEKLYLIDENGSRYVSSKEFEKELQRHFGELYEEWR